MAALAEQKLDDATTALSALLKRVPDAVKEAGGHAQLWGVDLLGSDEEALRVVVAKFARARDLDVDEAYKMMVNSLSWRKDVGVDDAKFDDEDFGEEFRGHDDLLPGLGRCCAKREFREL